MNLDMKRQNSISDVFNGPSTPKIGNKANWDDPIIETVEGGISVTQIQDKPATTAVTVVEPAKRVDLIECLKLMHEKTLMEKDNAFFCSWCDSKQKAEKTVALNQLPAILMLTLQRFRGGRKNEDIVDFPIRGLDLGPYCCSA